MNNVLVLGGTGFLGKNLQKVKPDWIYAGRTYFVEQGIKCDHECDYFDYNSVYDLINGINPDAVINLIADVGGIAYNNHNQISIYENNIIMNTNIIKACRELEIERVLSSLSTCAFPNDGVFPFRENNLFYNNHYDEIFIEPYEGHMGYGWSKRMLHVHSLLARKEGYNYSTFSPSNLYGPYDHIGEQNSHFVAALISKIEKADKELELYGDGKVLRQFLFAPDLAEVIPALLVQHNSEHPVIVAPEENLSIDEMAKIALKVVGKDLQIKYNGEHVGQLRKDGWNNTLKELLNNDISFTSFEDGFRETYQWYLENKCI